MTEQEFQNWQDFSHRSEHHWQSDPIHERQGEYLLYKGGVEQGVYILLQCDGTAEIGHYEGALPHIGEAAFYPLHSRRVAQGANGAAVYVLGRLGLGFLLDLLGLY